ncbi:hypothetical protein RvY_17758 [Ramazzottius varieornatus]|uniref:HSF-type DNA-binding domain-containing protein n=1 Tax=Ramazzottius varieornatus TaxID=947166 RepID=A0A1D1W390_RAMVA|nr:hypothetical protein RvY_17758 [Ramazzottius varieornatus]
MSYVMSGAYRKYVLCRRRRRVFFSDEFSDDHSDFFLQTGKLVSFIRQFNLYNFKKRHDVFVDVDGNGTQLRFGLYSHEYVRQGRADLLKHCKRKVVKRIHLTGCGGIKHKSYESDFEETSEEPVAVPVPTKKLRPQLTLPIKPEPACIPVVQEVFSLPSFKVSFIDTGIDLLNTSIATAVAQYHPPLPPPAIHAPTVIAPLPNVSRVQTRSSAVNKESAETKLRKETNKTLLMQRWMELPEEWQVMDMAETPEQNDDWLHRYNWNLDPMVVGELAALAGAGSELSLDFLDYCFPNGTLDLESLSTSSLDSLPSTSSQ